MAMVIFDERLAEILEDGNARRGWWLDLKRDEDEGRVRLIECSRVYDYSEPLEQLAAVA